MSLSGVNFYLGVLKIGEMVWCDYNKSLYLESLPEKDLGVVLVLL